MCLEWGGGQHIPFDTTTWKKKDIFKIKQKAAEEANILNTRIIRSCSGGLMRWQPASPMTETLLQETAKSLNAQRQMLKDHNVILALKHTLSSLRMNCSGFSSSAKQNLVNISVFALTPFLLNN